MKRDTTDSNLVPMHQIPETTDALTEICREGAQKMLQMAIENEVAEYIKSHSESLDTNGHRLVVRNGHHPERSIQTGLGNIPISKPKVNDKRVASDGSKMRFSSSIIPPYLKRSKTMEEFIPWLYLRGISSGDFNEALGSLLGPGASGLSASTVVNLKRCWEEEYLDWNKRSLKGKEYVYIWADGIYPRIRLDKSESQCFLVIMGATSEGKKELIAIGEGARESDLEWREVLLDLKRRGLVEPPKIAVGDGAIGFWQAISKVYPNTIHQRCWVHKTCNILAKLPKSQQSKAKGLLHNIWMAETRHDANEAFEHFLETYKLKYEKAAKCLKKDKDELLHFYDFPAEHWKHLRTSNPIESMFATIRLRTKRTKGHGNAMAALTMAFKLAKCAEKKWRKLSGYELIADVIDIKFKFVDGIKKAA